MSRKKHLLDEIENKETKTLIEDMDTDTKKMLAMFIKFYFIFYFIFLYIRLKVKPHLKTTPVLRQSDYKNLNVFIKKKISSIVGTRVLGSCINKTNFD